MASSSQMDFAYSITDRLVRLSLGELGSFSGAKYDGDFSQSLEAAQARKHRFVIERLDLAAGARVLDLGCGWGGMLAALRAQGLRGVGITLSRGQLRACRRHGLDVHLLDCRALEPATFGPFDGVVSLGAFEHFCSPEEWRAGRQDGIYRDVFRRAAAVLPARGRLVLQTMVFGPAMIPEDRIDLDAPRLSDGHILALLGKTFPGSWLPYGFEQVERAAAPYFRLLHKENGRLDYVETITQWRKRFAAFTWRKGLFYLSVLPRYLSSPDFRHAFVSGISANTIAFERLLLDHYRFVFQRHDLVPGEA